MKSWKLIFVLALCCVCLQVQAQFSLGVKGGYARVWQKYGDVDLPDDAQIHVNGIYLSTLAYYDINKFLRIGIEPGYAKRGAACVPGFTVFLSDTKLRLSYIEMPVMIMIKTPTLEFIEFFVKAGYGPSVIISAYSEVSTLGSEDPPERVELVIRRSGILNRWDHGLYTGIGIAFNLGPNKIFVETDYYLGFRDVVPFETSKNRSTHLGLGYMFSL